MKKIIPKLCVLTISILFLNKVHSESLCLEQENIVASCQLNEVKKRKISICYSSLKEKAFYRIGKDINNLEMTKEFTKNEPLIRWLNLGTYTTYFGFKNGTYYYQIADSDRVGQKPFLTVTDKSGKELLDKTCSDISEGNKKFKSNVIVDVDNDVVLNSKNLSFPVMFYEENNRELISAIKNKINYDKIGQTNIPISSNEIEHCVENGRLKNICQDNKRKGYPIYTYEQAIKLAPKLKEILDYFKDDAKNFIFLYINDNLYTLSIEPVGVADPKMQAYSLIRISESPYSSFIGNWFEITKAKKLKYKGDMGEPKSIQLD